MRCATVLTMAMLLLACASTREAQSALLVYEGFDYSTGSLAGNGGTSDFGFSGNWTTSGSSPSGNVVAPGLAQAPIESVEGAANMSGTGTTINFRTFDRVFDENDGETWVSILAQRTGDTASGNFAGVSFYNTSGTASGNAEWGLTATTLLGTQQWRIQELGASDGNSGTPIVNGQTDLLVAQIVWNGPGDQTMNLWLNPNVTGAGFGAPTNTINTSIVNFDKVRVASQNGAPFVFDELRIGETAADVIPGGVVPEPSSVLMAMGALLGVSGWRRFASRPMDCN